MTAVPKNKRIKDRSLLDEYKRYYCVVQSENCFNRPTVAKHWVTNGAGGNDIPENLNPMCVYCHDLKGRIGVKTFWKKFGDNIQKNRSLQGLEAFNP